MWIYSNAEKTVNSKPMVAAAEKFMCPDGIFYEKRSVLMLKTNAKLLLHKFHIMFRSKATRTKGEDEEW